VNKRTMGMMISRVATNLGILNTSAYATTQIPRFLQQVYEKIWNEDQWNDLVGQTYLATIAPNARSFVLPKKYSAVLKAYNDATGVPISIRDFPTFGDDAFTIDTVVFNINDFSSMARAASQGVLVQPSTPQVVKILSAAANDKGVSIRITGRDANGEVIAETILTNASNGTTPVASTNSYASITSISKTLIPSLGVISVTDNSGNQLGTIGQWEVTPEYRVYQLNGTTLNNATIQCIVRLAFVPMTNTFDVPLMNCCEALEDGATAEGFRESKDFEKAAFYDAKFVDDMGKLRTKEFEEEGMMTALPMMRC
jgi:hypothetical protein